MKSSSSNTNTLPNLPNAANSIESAKLGTWMCGSEDDSSFAVARKLAVIEIERIFIPETFDRTDSGESFTAAIGEHRGYRNRGYRNQGLNLQPSINRSSGWARHQTVAPR